MAPITPDFMLRLGHAVGSVLRREAETADGDDRQGHPHLRLHDRVGAGGRLRLCRRRRAAQRAAADARRGLPDARAAPGPGRGHQRLAQPVRRQRHQVLLGARRKAARRVGTRRRGRARGAAALGRFGGPGQGAPARRCRRPLHRVLQEHGRQRAVAEGPEAGGRCGAWRGLPRGAGCVPRTRRRCHRHRLQPGRHQHQRTDVGATAPAALVQRGAQRRRRLRHRARRRRRPAATGRSQGPPVQRRRTAVRDGCRPTGARTRRCRAWWAR